MNQLNPRKIGMEILNAIEQEEAYSNLAIQDALRNNKLKIEDKRLVSRLVYGVVENRMKLDYCIQKYSKTKIKKIQLSVLNILRLAVYQIDFMERIPNSAAVNEAVNLTKKVNFKSAGFVNGILRAYLRGNGCIIDGTKMSKVDYLSIEYSHPKWMVERFIEQWGPDKTIQILKANNEAADISFRINILKTDKTTLLDKLNKAGIKIKAGELLEESLVVERLGDKSIDEIIEFKNGEFLVQDISSMLVGHVVDPKPGELVIDVCAAPGGKTTHLAELMNNKGRVIAFDIHPHKIDLIKENATRLGLDNIQNHCWDARDEKVEFINSADKVLVDAPCSGLGIIRRKPEIRYTKSENDILSLSKVQLEILNVSANYVKMDGQLIYSTCTIDKEENIDNVMCFLQENPEFELEDINFLLPEQLKGSTKYLQVLPGEHGMDGFFIARFKRKN